MQILIWVALGIEMLVFLKIRYQRIFQSLLENSCSNQMLKGNVLLVDQFSRLCLIKVFSKVNRIPNQ